MPVGNASLLIGDVRDSVGIELSEEYAAMARERIEKLPRCAVPKKSKKVTPVDPAHRLLFE